MRTIYADSDIMATFKRLAICFAIFLNISYLVLTEDLINAKKESCVCAVMNGTDKEPLFEHSLPSKLGCDKNGTIGCRKLCLALTEAARLSGNGPQMLCEQLKKDGNIIVNLQSKVCGGPFTPTGLIYEKSICCENGKAHNCSECTKHSNSTKN